MSDYSAKEIFLEAIELDQESARQALLDERCQDNRALRAAVEKLLANYSQVDSFLESSPIHDDLEMTTDEAAVEPKSQRIGDYKLLQKVGEGGMGVVYMAEQLQPVRRRVALKIIKPGMDSKQVVARFEAERQALAMMDHPNIAKVLDAGTTRSGHPYFVMELVKGVPLTEYCDSKHLSLRDRLSLFVEVCDAVQHAHQKGIIHRDIKPSNVLVAEYDHRAVPKIIDFGVAKALNQQLTEKTMFTKYGQIVGTPEYMSPEQAKFNQMDVDIRSDIYSLGVLLYELLAGETPFDRDRLRSAAFDELIRIIREEAPPRPSTRAKSSATLPSIAEARNIAPVKLGAFLKGDLDLIVMKALDKDRDRRYETARDFALDINRFLSDQPVLATSPSVGYRARKYAKQHRHLITVASIIIVLLASGTIGTSMGWIHARRLNKDLKLANEELMKLGQEKQQNIEEMQSLNQQLATSKLAAENKANEAEAVNDFLNGVLTPESQALQVGAEFQELTMREVLDRAVEQLNEESESGGRYADQPLIEAAIRRSIGNSYRAIGEFELAEGQLRLALVIREELLGEAHVDTIYSKYDLATLFDWGFKKREAASLYRETYEGFRRALGEDERQTIQAMINLGASLATTNKVESEQVLREALEAATHLYGPDDSETLMCKSHLSLVVQDREELARFAEEAIDGFRRIGNELLMLEAINDFALNHWDPARKVELITEAAEGFEKLLGADHPTALVVRQSQVATLLNLDMNEQAEAAALGPAKIAVSTIGDRHFVAAELARHLALAQTRNGKLEEAESNGRVALDLFRSAKRYFRLNYAVRGLSDTLMRQGKFKEAKAIENSLVEDCEQAIMVRDADAFKFGLGVLWALEDSHRWDDFRRLSQLFFRVYPEAPKDDPIMYLYLLSSYGYSLCLEKDFQAAGEILGRAELLCDESMHNELQFLRDVIEWRTGEIALRTGSTSDSLRHLVHSFESLVAQRKSREFNLAMGALRKLVSQHPVQAEVLAKRCRELITSRERESLMACNHYLDVLRSSLNAEENCKLAGELLDAQEAVQGLDQVNVSWTKGLLADALIQLGQFVEASRVVAEFRSQQQSLFNGDQYLHYWPMMIEGELLLGQGNTAGAESHFREAIVGFAEHPGWDMLVRANISFVRLYRSAVWNGHKSFELIDLGNSSLEEDSNLPSLLALVAADVMVQLDQGKLAEALIRRWLQREKNPGLSLQGWAYGLLSLSLTQQDRFEEAKETLEECRRYNEAANTRFQPNWNWHLTVLGRWHLAQGHFEEAEEQLVASYEHYSYFNTAKYHELWFEHLIVKDLVTLYERWNSVAPSDELQEKLETWQKRLVKYGFEETLTPKGETVSP